MTSFFRGVLLFVTKCDKGERGSKIGQNSVTSFMDGPLHTLPLIGHECSYSFQPVKSFPYRVVENYYRLT